MNNKRYKSREVFIIDQTVEYTYNGDKDTFRLNCSQSLLLNFRDCFIAIFVTKVHFKVESSFLSIFFKGELNIYYIILE